MNPKTNSYIFYAFNKKWRSINACCQYYQVRYGSVLSYKRIHGCTTEEAIEYYRNLKKQNIFYFKKNRWTSLEECCDFYNINFNSLCTYMYKNKTSKEEALEYYYQHYQNERFTFNNITYDSFTKCCEDLGVTAICIKRYARKKHFILRRALISYLNYYNKRKFYFRDQEYKTFTECCRKFSCTASNVIAYAKRHHISKSEALEAYITKNKGKRNFIFHGVFYSSIKECCDKLGLNADRVYVRSWKLKVSKEESIEYFYQKKNQCFEWNGIAYPTLAECCQVYHIPEGTVKSWAYRENCSLQEALQCCIEKRENMKIYYEGVLYDNLEDCCKKYQINRQSVHSYRHRNKGCDISEAIDYIRDITEKTKFIWIEGSVYQSLPVFCKLNAISVISVRDKARKKNISLQESAKYYIERKKTV